MPGFYTILKTFSSYELRDWPSSPKEKEKVVRSSTVKWTLNIRSMARDRRGDLKTSFMQTIQLQNLGVRELAANELETINGGELPSWLKGVTFVGIASEVIDHWDEIKKGLVDGWNAVKTN